MKRMALMNSVSYRR